MPSFLKSREFWFTVFALFALVMTSFIPNFSLDKNLAADLVITIIAYVGAVVLDPGQGWAGLFKSRKFWMLAVSLALVFTQAFGIEIPFELSPDQLTAMITMLAGGMVAIGAKDRLKVPQA